jgi:predicted HTH domain antitoxin
MRCLERLRSFGRFRAEIIEEVSRQIGGSHGEAQKMVSIRLEADDYKFLSNLAEADKEDLSTAVRDLLTRGRRFLALERYREGNASLSKAAEVAGVSISEMMDLLGEHGIPSDLRLEDYREGLRKLREVW